MRTYGFDHVGTTALASVERNAPTLALPVVILVEEIDGISCENANEANNIITNTMNLFILPLLYLE
jgi:hypothetical protein